MAADLIGLVAAFLVAQIATGHTYSADGMSAVYQALGFLATLPAWVVVARLQGLYHKDEERAHHGTLDDFVGVFQVVTLGTWIVYATATLSGLVAPQTDRAVLFWALAIALVTLARTIARAVCRRHPSFIQNTVIVGAGETGQLVAKKLLQRAEYRLKLVGFVDANAVRPPSGLDELGVLGSPDQLPDIVRVNGVERVIIASSSGTTAATVELIRRMTDLDVQVDIVPRFFEIVGSRSEVHTIEGLPLMGVPSRRLSNSSRLLKRSFDVGTAAVTLILLTPFFALAALAIKLDSRGPVFFRQVRMGAGNRTFRIWKLRTMVADADERKAQVAHLNQHARNGGDPRMFKVPSDPRITRVGRRLRRYSLDELPQLLNVLSGRMSLVGPRPLILEEHRFVHDWARKRLDLKPGMTGLWQVLGASEIPFEEMVKLDYLYVTDWSLTNDLKLMLRTLPAVARSRVAI